MTNAGTNLDSMMMTAVPELSSHHPIYDAKEQARASCPYNHRLSDLAKSKSSPEDADQQTPQILIGHKRQLKFGRLNAKNSSPTLFHN